MTNDAFSFFKLYVGTYISKYAYTASNFNCCKWSTSVLETLIQE